MDQETCPPAVEPQDQPISWAPEVKVVGNGENWSRNNLRFATKAEAERSAYSLMMRWSMVEDYRAAPATEPANHAIVDNRQVSLTDLANEGGTDA